MEPPAQAILATKYVTGSVYVAAVVIAQIVVVKTPIIARVAVATTACVLSTHALARVANAFLPVAESD